MFAVSPAKQRGGLGRRLMGEALARADAAEVPAYLWTANRDNLPYYRSHGYEVTGETTIPAAPRPGTWSGPCDGSVTATT